jgi:hypothetical protein
LKDYSANFGLAIAFVAPGVVGLWGLSFFYPSVRSWFGASPGASPTAPAFLFVLLASTSMGLVISGLQQELLDWLFKVTKWAVRPATDDSKLVDPNTLEALRFVADSLYRYAQFYGNMAVALVFAYACWLAKRGFWPWHRPGIAVAVSLAAAIMVLSTHYSLSRYYKALEDLIGTEQKEG